MKNILYNFLSLGNEERLRLLRSRSTKNENELSFFIRSSPTSFLSLVQL